MQNTRIENDFSNIKERIMLFVEHKHIPKGKFFEKIGVTSANFRGKAKDSPLNSSAIERIVSEFPDLSLEWLLSGKGEMFRKEPLSGEQDGMSFVKKYEEDSTGRRVFSIEKKEEFRLVPLINLDAVGGFSSNNDITISDPQYLEGLIPFVGAQVNDLCIPVSGNSMAPTCPSGCLILIRENECWQEYFGYGHIYCILLKDGRRILKEIQKYDENPKEYVLCVSHNKDVPAEELPRDMIVKVWRVIKILTQVDW